MKKFLVIVLGLAAATVVPVAIALFIVRKYHSHANTEMQLNQAVAMEASNRADGALVLGGRDVAVNDVTATAIQETVRE